MHVNAFDIVSEVGKSFRLVLQRLLDIDACFSEKLRLRSDFLPYYDVLPLHVQN